MKGWILYTKKFNELTEDDYGVSRLLNAAIGRGIALEVYTPDQFELIVSRDDRKSILIDGKSTPIPDFLIPRMGSATHYFALAIIRQLERLGVYSCNSSTSIELVKDKLHMHQLLSQSNLPSPKTMLAKFPVEVSVLKREIGFPTVIKNITGTGGSGICLCESEEKLANVIELVYSNNEKAAIILQEFIADSQGKDLRVFVIGGKVVGCMKRFSETTFKANFSLGGKVVPFKLTREVEWLAIETARLAGLDIAGIDLLFDKDGYKVCEANSAPGFKGLELVVTKCIAEQILDYVAIRVGAHNFN